MVKTLAKKNVNLKKGGFFKNINCIRIMQIIGFVFIFSTTIAFAEPSVDKFTQLIAEWTQKVGGIIAFIGAILFATGWRNDDPGERIKGVKTFIAGAMIFSIAKGYTMFM